MEWIEGVGRDGFLQTEVTGAEFGDRRLSRRLEQIVGASLAGPSTSFPAMSDGDSALEGTYRFLNNERVTPEAILAPHVRATVARVRSANSVVIAHDTTEFSFGANARGDLGRVGRGSSYGFDAHFSLAVMAGEERVPLGVLGVTPFNRPFGSARLPNGRNKSKPGNTMHRWIEQVRRVRAHLGEIAQVVHVMDREADDYVTLAELVRTGERFVVRQSQDRRLRRYGEAKVRSVIEPGALLATREVRVSARRPSNKKAHRKRHPPRQARLAQLEIRAGTVTVERTASAADLASPTLQLNLVQVLEPNPPSGCEPVTWWLWTNEPVASSDDVLAVIDAYRSRWSIEEYFKALKSGCAIEQRQLESRHALLNALAVFVPVAWRLMLLRSVARHAPETTAAVALTPLQIRALCGFMAAKHKHKMPERPSAREAMDAIARIGGHIPNNGDPGWAVLGRGLDRLLDVELGLAIATGAM